MSRTTENAMMEDESILPIQLDYELMPRDKRIAKVRGIVDDMYGYPATTHSFVHLHRYTLHPMHPYIYIYIYIYVCV
jgi:hypothetical protein